VTVAVAELTVLGEVALSVSVEECEEDDDVFEALAGAERTKAPAPGSSSGPPGYLAVIVVADVVWAGVKLTEHDPPASTQASAGVNPVPLLLCQVTVPLGDAPVTVAVQVMSEPMASSGGEQLTVTLARALTTEIVKLPELGELLASPK
jgi:hypothetical protein